MTGTGGLDAEVVVVGAGVVGLAIAERLSRDHRVLVIERREGIARETSSHNSGVVHAGIYYETGSLKHRLCIEGNAALWRWTAEHGVPAKQTGKLIVALTEDERDGLDAVYAQASANGVPGIERLSGARARELEPQVPIVEAVYSPSTGVVDNFAYARSLGAEARAHGALIAHRHALTGVERVPGGFELTARASDGEPARLRCAALVNSAGLGAPAVAAMLGVPLDGGEGVPRLRQWVNRGRYYDIVNTALARSVSRPIYPLPDHHAGGLGLHLTVDVEGGAHLGPSMEWIDDSVPLDYRNDDSEREAFLASGQRFLPGLRDADIAPGQVGYRPKVQAPGEGLVDWVIWEDRGYVHLGGIESPGLTASLPLAREVAALL